MRLSVAQQPAQGAGKCFVLVRLDGAEVADGGFVLQTGEDGRLTFAQTAREFLGWHLQRPHGEHDTGQLLDRRRATADLRLTRAETTTHRQMREFNLNAAAAALTVAMTEGQATAAEAQLNYGLTQMLRGEYVSAAETFAQTLRKGQNHVEMTYLTGMCYVLAALREREEHETRDDTPAPAVRELFLKARPFLERAIEVQSVAEAAAYDLGLLNYMLGDYPRAIEVLRRITRPDSPSYLVNTLALAQAKLAQSLQFTAQTATLMPDSRKREIRAQARQLLAAAIHYFKQALAIEPLAPLTHANMGLALMLRNQKGDVESALEHWQLMHQHGDARHRRTYEQFMQVMSPEGAQKLRFQDVELGFHRVEVRDWVVFPQPRPAGFRFVVRELMDEPEWQLQAEHRLVRRALAYRQKAERVRRKLRRLAI
jgi:tetratricopeptide (TPR) repeat protein